MSMEFDASLKDDRLTIFTSDFNAAQLAGMDLLDGIKKWRIWLMLAYQDVRLRYRRSVLGPFWLTISMAITVFSMGYLYSYLFHIEVQKYFPFLVAGMLGWVLISTVITDYSDAFIMVEGLIKQIKLPYTVHIHRIIVRNIIIFFHNIIIMLPVIFIFKLQLNFSLLLLIPGMLCIYINAMTYGLLLAILGTRFRDISQLVRSLVQVIFFVTPIMWNPEMLSENKRFIIDCNPIYAFLELIRQPLLGGMPSLKNWLMVVMVTFIGIFASALLFTRYRARLVYWL